MPVITLKKRTLSGKRQYDAAFAGKKVVTRDVVFFYTPNGLDHGRLGAVVSRKVQPRAVERNRLKRRVRELFRLHRDALAGYDLVVLPRKGRERGYPALESAFEKLLKAIS